MKTGVSLSLSLESQRADLPTRYTQELCNGKLVVMSAVNRAQPPVKVKSHLQPPGVAATFNSEIPIRQ